MTIGNISLDFRLQNIDETRNFLLEVIKQNDLMSKKHKNVFRALNYFEYILIFVSATSGCVSISAFASLVGSSIGIASSALALKICALIAPIKKHNSIIKEKRKNQYKIVLLAKTKSNIKEVVFSKALIDSYISHDEVISVNNVLKEYGEMKEVIKNSCEF